MVVGTKERLFEMVQRVHPTHLNEGNEDLVDFMKTVKNDYPYDDTIQIKFLNLAKRKGVDVAKNEYDSNYSPEGLKRKGREEKSREYRDRKTEKQGHLEFIYGGIIELVQELIKKRGVYELVLDVFRESEHRLLVRLLKNKTYTNEFNWVIKDMVGFERRYLRRDDNLIPIETLKMVEFKPKSKDREWMDPMGLTLIVESYLKSGAIKGEIDGEDLIMYRVVVQPDFDDHIFSGGDSSYGGKLKYESLLKLGRDYNRRVLKPNELDIFFKKFIDIYTTPEKHYNERILTRLNESEVMEDDRTKTIKRFVGFASEKLGIINNLPGITISYDGDVARRMKSFGKFEDGKILVVVTQRNLADVLRTLCHEMVHHKQFLEGRLNPESGRDGSEHENEAHATVGVILREFGRENPEIFEG